MNQSSKDNEFDAFGENRSELPTDLLEVSTATELYSADTLTIYRACSLTDHSVFPVAGNSDNETSPQSVLNIMWN